MSSLALSLCLPPCTPDLGGAASLLLELGGMVIFHDAAGCCENYTVYDESRWYGSDAMVYSSSLLQLDAVLGNDAPLLDGAAAAAQKLHPNFIALLGTPVPAVIGMDLDGMAAELEHRTQLPVFAVSSTGFSPWWKGAGEALSLVLQRFAKPCDAPRARSVNLLGVTPLDFLEPVLARLRTNLEAEGWEIHGVYCMGAPFSALAAAPGAQRNLVVSRAGLPAAEFLQKKFGMPYTPALPFTRRQARTLQLAQNGTGKRCLVLGEALGAQWLADALAETQGWETHAAAAELPEAELTALLQAGWDYVVGDPLYRVLLSGAAQAPQWFSLAHRALSSHLSETSDAAAVLHTLLDGPVCSGPHC